jgi:hypothetical protein
LPYEKQKSGDQDNEERQRKHQYLVDDHAGDLPCL